MPTSICEWNSLVTSFTVAFLMRFSKMDLWLALVSTLFLSLATSRSAGSPPISKFQSALQSAPKADESYYSRAHPDLEQPLERLIQHIPELKTIQPAQDQQQLPSILEKAARQVDEFFRNVIDLTAQEQITEEKQDSRSNIRKRLEAVDSYLIIHRGGDFLGRVAEYRVDAKGNPMEEVGLSQGYFDTSNFALDHIYFATAHQAESQFLYLGEQKIGSQNTYVVAFAQKPGDAIITVAMVGREGVDAPYAANMLVQGIAWIDSHNFQIIRLRTDLLAPRPEINLDRLTNTVTFSEVQLPDVATPLWLPSQMQVVAEFTEPDILAGLKYSLRFSNEHHYSNYQSFRVSVRMLTDSTKVANSPVYVLPTGATDQSYYANARPYLNESLKELGKYVPELKNVKPAPDDAALPDILKKTAANVDEFFHHIVDLIAREEITQVRRNYFGVIATEQVHDSYLILRRGNPIRTDIEEYRMDAKGNRMDHVGLDRGYVVTFGFALNSNYFSTAFQPDSKFRYLGDQRLGPRDTYVVAFAQQPGMANLFVTMVGGKNTRIRMLVQGVAWIDKSNFQIIRMHTDLLAPRPEIALDRQTTEVTFNQVQLPDVAAPLWLPSEVKVYLKFKAVDRDRKQTYELSFQNEHHYSEYRRYRVSVKMLPPT
jgi:hypothetical protein